MQRREFIQTGAMAAAGVLLNGWNPDIVLGHNNKRYRLNTRWSQADAMRYPVNDCHEMVQDKEGRIFLLTNETKNNIIVYNRSGKLLFTWGREYPGAHGLTLFDGNGEETLFICDNQRHEVIQTTLDGIVLMTLGYPKASGQYAKAEEYIPTETAIAANGDIYVADGYGKDFIIQYNYKGEYIRHFGGRGSEEKHLKNAHGIAVDLRDPTQPCLIVTSREENAFKRFTMDGQWLETIALPGAWVCRPVIKGDYLYAAVLQSSSRPWKASGFVTILDKNNKVISNLAGSQPEYEGRQPKEMYQTIRAFQYPHDVCVDDEENLYVAQWNSGRAYPFKLEPVP